MTERKNSKQKIVQFLRSRAGHFALTYLIIIMFMSIAGSAVFYFTASQQLERQLPPPSFYDRGHDVGMPDEPVHRVDFDDFFTQRIDQGHAELLERLILINILAMLLGSLVSYALARRMLRPINVVLTTQKHLLHETGQFPELDELSALRISPLTLKAVSLQAVVHSALDHVKTLKDRVVSNSIPDVQVLGDKQTLTRLMEILLKNAVEYSADQTAIHISAERKSGEVSLIIRDEGMGINRTDLPHIFTEFYQADHTHQLDERRGHGLGLAVARAIAEANGGNIRITSVVDQGSTVTVELKGAQS